MTLLRSNCLTVDFLDHLEQGRSQAGTTESSTGTTERNLCLRVVFCGEPSCGKSAFVSYWATGKPFSRNSSPPAVGVDFMAVPFTCPAYSPATNNVSVHLWDLGGAPEFPSAFGVYYRLSSAIVFCYSLEDVLVKGIPLQELIRSWVRDASCYAEGGIILVPIVCGMKRDLVRGQQKIRTQATHFSTSGSLLDGESFDWESFKREIECILESALVDAGCRCLTPVKGFVTSAKEKVGLHEVLDYVVRRCVDLVNGVPETRIRRGAVRLPPAHPLPTPTNEQQEAPSKSRCCLA
jgi:GTPase SAR1 family protein